MKTYRVVFGYSGSKFVLSKENKGRFIDLWNSFYSVISKNDFWKTKLVSEQPNSI